MGIRQALGVSSGCSTALGVLHLKTITTKMFPSKKQLLPKEQKKCAHSSSSSSWATHLLHF